ncbi:MAG: aldehyde dehydrogenase family protein, partial [Chloroflexi bacterium]|nr:aldehyde dehydrogenase family protein [Chloroflexota bacterium]
MARETLKTRSTVLTKRIDSVTVRTKSSEVGRGTSAPSSWGLGDGQAIPWEYAPAPEARDIVQLQSRYGLFVGGKEIAPRSGEWFTTIDPATEEPLADVARANHEDVDHAVGVARRAYRRTWRTMPGRERAK